MGRHYRPEDRPVAPPWHCFWDPTLQVFVEIPMDPQEDLTMYDHLVQQTEKSSPEDPPTEPISQDPNWDPERDDR